MPLERGLKQESMKYIIYCHPIGSSTAIQFISHCLEKLKDSDGYHSENRFFLFILHLPGVVGEWMATMNVFVKVSLRKHGRGERIIKMWSLWKCLNLHGAEDN